MIKFKEINDGLTCVTGLTSELESLYINDVYNKKDSNVLVVTSSIYEANKLYEIVMRIIGTEIKNKLKHPFKSQD